MDESNNDCLCERKLSKSNMMSINNRLGFKSTIEEKSYKFNIKDTLAKLQKK